jgi:UDP-N-acetyl-D-galactosamine dehydrogenase
VLGITFKENVPDLRNSRVIDIIRGLEDYGIEVQVTDPLADVCEARSTYDVIVRPASELKRAHCVIFAVPHDTYVDEGWRFVSRLLREGEGVVVDIKGVLAREAAPHGVTIWRL